LEKSLGKPTKVYPSICSLARPCQSPKIDSRSAKKITESIPEKPILDGGNRAMPAAKGKINKYTSKGRTANSG
jgi:hypothetical protein